jgi:uncharacterized protein VirK/YbjX
VSLEDSNVLLVHAYSELIFLFRMQRFQYEATVLLALMVRRGKVIDKQFTAQVHKATTLFVGCSQGSKSSASPESICFFVYISCFVQRRGFILKVMKHQIG